jgi:hypothetical protein
MGLAARPLRKSWPTPSLSAIRCRDRRKPVIGPQLGAIGAILAYDKEDPPKQRHTARRIFERLRDEHGNACCHLAVRDPDRGAVSDRTSWRRYAHGDDGQGVETPSPRRSPRGRGSGEAARLSRVAVGRPDLARCSESELRSHDEGVWHPVRGGCRRSVLFGRRRAKPRRQ